MLQAAIADKEEIIDQKLCFIHESMSTIIINVSKHWSLYPSNNISIYIHIFPSKVLYSVISISSIFFQLWLLIWFNIFLKIFTSLSILRNIFRCGSLSRLIVREKNPKRKSEIGVVAGEGRVLTAIKPIVWQNKASIYLSKTTDPSWPGLNLLQWWANALTHRTRK